MIVKFGYSNFVFMLTSKKKTIASPRPTAYIPNEIRSFSQHPIHSLLSPGKGQSKALYDAFVAITNDEVEMSKMDQAQKRILESSIRDMTLSGVGLEGEAKERFKVSGEKK